MSSPNMENKLAILWRENVRKLLDHCDMKASDLADFCDRSQSTLQSCFGGTTIKAMSSAGTIAQLETGFNLNIGALSSPRFNPAKSGVKAPSAEPVAPLASINIPIPAHKLAQIMRILADD